MRIVLLLIISAAFYVAGAALVAIAATHFAHGQTGMWPALLAGDGLSCWAASYEIGRRRRL